MHTHVIDTWLCPISSRDCSKIYFGSARTSWSFAGAKRELENANWGLVQCSQDPPQVLIVCSSNALIAYGNCGSWLHTQIATHTHTPSWPWHMSGNEQVAANCGKQSGISKTERRKSSSSLPLCSIMHSAGRGEQQHWVRMVGWILPSVSLAENACAFVSWLSFCRDLRFNHIEELPANAFNGLGQLTTLFLNDNELAYVHDDAFKDLNALRFLYLSKNRLSRLPAGIFRHLPKLEVL